jgi:hypothetical protein
LTAGEKGLGYFTSASYPLRGTKIKRKEGKNDKRKKEKRKKKCRD